MSMNQYEKPPGANSQEEHPVKPEKRERSGDAWLENPVLFAHALEDVGRVISEMQMSDQGVYAGLPLSDDEMEGLARMYLKGIEDGRPLEDLHAEIENFVRRKRAKRAA
jgi:hypothetical protein